MAAAFCFILSDQQQEATKVEKSEDLTKMLRRCYRLVTARFVTVEISPVDLWPGDVRLGVKGGRDAGGEPSPWTR